MKILILGDVFGRIGRNAVKQYLEDAREKLKLDLIIANADNVASGRGPTLKTYEEMIEAGIDVMTCGDHIWDQKEASEILTKRDSKLIRPANYPADCPGKGSISVEVKGQKVAIVALLGRVFTTEGLESPFTVADKVLADLKEKIIVVDFHAEATSEKNALGYYLADRVSAVVGTHTHVQTSDERIIDGCAYISDIGFCGARDSVIGVKKELSIQRFLSAMPLKYEAGEGRAQVNGVVITIDEKTGRAGSIERIFEIIEN